MSPCITVQILAKAADPDGLRSGAATLKGRRGTFLVCVFYIMALGVSLPGLCLRNDSESATGKVPFYFGGRGPHSALLRDHSPGSALKGGLVVGLGIRQGLALSGQML